MAIKDKTITESMVTEGRWILVDMTETIRGARMEFKLSKSRSMVLKGVSRTTSGSGLGRK